MAALRRITQDDLPRLKQFWREHWLGEEMMVHGDVYRPEQVEGFVNEDWTGLVTYGSRVRLRDHLADSSGRHGHRHGTDRGGGEEARSAAAAACTYHNDNFTAWFLSTPGI
jgi:hypothetical protein